MDAVPYFDGMCVFVSIVEHGSISGAGRALGLPKSTVSRRLARLERRLGVPLLHRSTRRLSLTEAGLEYHARSRPLVAAATATEHEVRARTGTPSGRIRVTAAAGFGQVVLMPKLIAFMERYPRVSIDFEPTDRIVDLIEEGFDLAVQIGPLRDSSLFAKRLWAHRRILVASPRYLADAPPLHSAEDLRQHSCIVVRPDADHWQFDGPAGSFVVRVPWRFAVRSVFCVRDAAIAHQGIGEVPEYVVSEALAAGTLVRVLERVRRPMVVTNAVYPRTKTQALAVRRLIAFLSEEFRRGRSLFDPSASRAAAFQVASAPP
jgi:DNA-binding transcriptional LysR family regulator